MHPDELTLNDYAEEALAGPGRAEVERHLEVCDACRAVVEDFRAIRRAASSLPAVPPPPSAWNHLQEAIRREGAPGTVRRERWAPTPAQLGWFGIAAALVLATIVGLRMGPFGPGTASVGSSATSTSTAGDVESVESELRQAEEHYTKAITGLQQIASEGEGELDPETAATLQKTLAVVDQAISESRAAVRSEPTNETAQQSLLENFSTKIALLQDTVSLINEMRKGNDAGAAEIVSGLK